MVFEPVRSYIHTKSIIIAPHKLLHYVPFQALRDSRSDRYLIENYTISYIPSGSVLEFVSKNTKLRSGDALVIGNPKVPGLPNLPASEGEAAKVAELYGVKAYIGYNGTETTFYRHASEARIVHLACHGKFNPIAPLFSSLALASDSQNDGDLYVVEIYDTEMPLADIVTLSACETTLEG